ncbi:MAG: hypothetical protein KatS3mg062_0976 [Tepidiforma sp.]|nr:MAG: hypothetical protein KatS3mg062_0976 [Tepidiforma sp.]
MTTPSARPWAIALLAWAALIFTLSSFPNPPGPRVTEPRAVAAHVVIYAVFGFLALHVIARWRSGLSRKALLAAWLLAVLYGISDEVHQSFVPNRHATVFDVLADAFGAALGVSLARVQLARAGWKSPLSRTADRPGRSPSHRAQ